MKKRKHARTCAWTDPHIAAHTSLTQIESEHWKELDENNLEIESLYLEEQLNNLVQQHACKQQELLIQADKLQKLKSIDQDTLYLHRFRPVLLRDGTGLGMQCVGLLVKGGTDVSMISDFSDELHWEHTGVLFLKGVGSALSGDVASMMPIDGTLVWDPIPGLET